MMRSVPYAWLQLKQDKLRLLAAVGGITFAVVLVFMQLGLRAALFDSSVRVHRGMDYDLVMLSPRTIYLARTNSFPRSRLYQVAGVDEVKSVSPLYVYLALYYYDRTPDIHRTILVLGIDPTDDNVRLDGVSDQLQRLRRPDTVIMDRYSRAEFEKAVTDFEQGAPVQLQLNERRVNVIGHYGLGTSFGIEPRELGRQLLAEHSNLCFELPPVVIHSPDPALKIGDLLEMPEAVFHRSHNLLSRFRTRAHREPRLLESSRPRCLPLKPRGFGELQLAPRLR